jgi:hydroxyethylthiazole kinase-like uncharacterized protein yjeF
LIAVRVPEARVFALPETNDGAISGEAAALVSPRVSRCAALVIGPDMLRGKEASALAVALLSTAEGPPPVVLDAGAISAAAMRQSRGGSMVITPHSGEMADLLKIEKEEIEADPARFALQAAAKLQAVVALKGATTQIADPSGEAWVFRGGSIGLATSGSGDVLAGVIGGLLARGASAEQAAIWGVHLHAKAARRLERRLGAVGLLARELAGEIPPIMEELSI